MGSEGTFRPAHSETWCEIKHRNNIEMVICFAYCAPNACEVTAANTWGCKRARPHKLRLTTKWRFCCVHFTRVTQMKLLETGKYLERCCCRWVTFRLFSLLHFNTSGSKAQCSCWNASWETQHKQDKATQQRPLKPCSNKLNTPVWHIHSHTSYKHTNNWNCAATRANQFIAK